MTDLKEQTAQNKLAKKLDIRNYAELVELGHDSLEQEKFDFALKVFMQAIQLDANGCEAYHGRGCYYFDMENYDLALADFNKAIQLNPNFSRAYRGIGICYKIQNNDELYFEWIKKAAELGDIISQYRIGIHYRYGIKIEKNLELAFEWLNKAAEQGNIEAQYELADCYLYGLGIEKNPELAFNLFKKAAEQEHIEAQYELSMCYFYGKGTDGDSVLGFEWCKKAAEQGNIEAQYELADCYLNGIGIEKNPELGFELLNKLAEQDNIKAQYLLADCYLKGMGIEKNIKLGFELLKKLDEQKDTQAEWKPFDYYHLAKSKIYDYFHRDKENENLEEELQWFEKKAEQGDINAYYFLAEVYFEGIKVKKNRILALEWLEKSFTQEKSDKYRLARIYLNFAYGFESDNSELEISEQKIIDLYIKAAEYGSVNAYIRLADYYRLGNHVEKNDTLAFAYYEKAFEKSGEKFENSGEKDDEIARAYKMSYYPDIKIIASLQLSRYYTEGKIVEKDLDKAAFYQQQIDEDIKEKKDSLKFPYKSAFSYYCEEKDHESKLEGKDKVDYLSSKGRFDEAREAIDNDDDRWFYLHAYPELKKETNEQNKKLKKLNAELKEKNQQLEKANKQIKEKEKELEDMMSMFAHKFRSPLDAIIYNTSHSKDTKLYTESANTMRGLLDIFSIISADDKILTDKIKNDSKGNATLMSVLNKNLNMTLLHLLSVSGMSKIHQHYMNYAKAQGKITDAVSYKEWCDDYFEMEGELQKQWEQEFSALLNQSASLAERLQWLEQYFFKLDIIGFEIESIQFKEYETTESFLFILMNEILVNAFKYYASESKQAVVLEWTATENDQILSCRNPSIRRERDQHKGSGKGHTFLSALARKTGCKFTKPKPQDDFLLEFAIPNQLLLSNSGAEK